MFTALFGGGAGTSAAGVSGDLLAAWAASKAGVGVDVKAAGADPNAPLAPVWTPGVSPSDELLVQRALSNRRFFDLDAKLYSDLGAVGDYKRLFALYSGLATLNALAGRAGDETLSRSDRSANALQFARGLTELEAFFAQQEFEDVRLAQGDRVDAAQTTLAMPTRSEDYVTGIIHRGGLYNTVSGLAADAKFNIVATSLGGTVRVVAIDLSDMGSVSRTLGNVISHVNNELAAAGASSRLEAVDLTPKTNTIVVGGQAMSLPYVGPKQYALKVDVRAGERVAFEAAATAPAFYAVGTTAAGASLIKFQDVDGFAGQPALLARPDATADPTGAYVATGWFGPGAGYGAPPAGAAEQRTQALLSDGANNFEDSLRAAGDALLMLELADGRTVSVSTAWRDDDAEAWRIRGGESEDRGIADDLAERLTQLLHEQGVAAGVDVWEDGTDIGFSIYTGDGVRASSLIISGRAATLEPVDKPGMVGGLRDGVFARRFEAAAVAGASDLFTGVQTFTITTTAQAHIVTVDGGEAGVDAATLIDQVNAQLRERGIAAAASFADLGGTLSFRLDALHDTLSVNAILNEASHDVVLQAPGAWASGGLPASSAGQHYGDAVRTYNVAGGAPLLTHAGAVDIEVVVATPAGAKTVNVSVSAAERAADPDPSPGQWSAAFQGRLDQALNAAGVYVAAAAGDLSTWSVAESAGQRIQSVSINGAPLTLEGAAPAFGLGGAFSAARSFTSAQAATGVSDDVPALVADQAVSITIETIWGARTVSAALQAGDPRTLESTALRLNEALAAEGYDLGLAAVALSGGGAGLRAVSGASHSLRGVTELNLGGDAYSFTLDPIDAAAHADDPVGALRVAERAARGAAVTEAIPSASTLVAPSSNAAGWFPGRAFDVSVGGGAKVATARSVASAADGSIYVLADLAGDSASTAIKGARDVALFKYDSAGKLAFTQILGAAQSASGFALAVSAEGKIAVAGSVEGSLSNAEAGKGGADSFVTLFEADGTEIWTARRGASANDQVNAIAFAPDGSIVVAGQTESALSGQVAIGASDAYVRGYSAAGVQLFTRQFGTSAADAATALLVRDDGAGGMEIFTGGVENNRGVLRRFAYSSSSGFAAGATRDIGFLHEGGISALAADGASLYVGGSIGADRLTLGAAARAAVAGKEGFVARLDADLVSTSLDRASYLGSAQDDAVNSLAIVNGAVYAAGVAGGLLAGSGGAKAQSSFIARLGDDGEAAWARTFNSAGGLVSVSSLAVDQTGASALDVLGLPRGEIAATDSGLLTDRSALRAGDEFRIGVDGRLLTTIRVAASDTFNSFFAAISRAVSGGGRAEIVREDGVERIKITAREGQALRIEAGRDGRDALGALGLTPGLIATNAAKRGSLKSYGLGLIAADLKLDSAQDIAKTKAEISAAISIVRQAYESLVNPNAKDLTDEEKALEERRRNAGAAPQYYLNQLANYQAALARLTGG
jgi:hypothetical protein